jgi:hypothetical protein
MEPIRWPQSAFPVNFSYVDEAGVTQIHVGAGMSLRDYFAAKHSAVLLSMPVTAEARRSLSHDERLATIAATAYALADAMLAERERK